MMRGLAVVPDRLLRIQRPTIRAVLPIPRAGQRLVTQLPSRAPDGTPISWVIEREFRPAASADLARPEVRDDVLFSRTPFAGGSARVGIELVGVSQGGMTYRWAGWLQGVSGRPGAWTIPDYLEPVGGERVLDEYTLTCWSTSVPAWCSSYSTLSGRRYFSVDVHAPLLGGETLTIPTVAVGIADSATVVPARTPPGNGNSVGVARTAGTFEVRINGILVDSWLDIGAPHRRVDFDVDEATRQVRCRTSGAYTWRGPFTVPGTSPLVVVARVTHEVRHCHARLVTRPQDLSWHVDVPAGATLGWSD